MVLVWRYLKIQFREFIYLKHGISPILLLTVTYILWELCGPQRMKWNGCCCCCCWCSIHSGVSNMSTTQISQNDNKRHIKKTGSFTFGSSFFLSQEKLTEYHSETVASSILAYSIQFYCFNIDAYVCLSIFLRCSFVRLDCVHVCFYSGSVCW